MSLRRKVLSNSIFQLVGKVLTTVTSLVLVAFITRSLGVSGYGNYITVLAYTQFFGIFADFGVNLYLIKRLSVAPEGDEETRAMFGLRVVSTIVILGIGAIGTFLTPYSPEVRTAILIGLVAIGAQTLNSLGVSVLQARLTMLPAVTAEVLGRLATLVLSVVAVKMGFGLFGIISAVVIGAVGNLYLTFRASNTFLKSSMSWQPEIWLRILKASLPISLTAVLSYLYFKSDTVLLSLLPLEGGKLNDIEVGIYGAAYKVLEMLLLVPAIFVGNIFPIISEFWAKQDERLRGTLQQTFDLMAIFGTFMTVTVLMLARPIILFVAGPDFVDAVLPLQILAMTIFVTFFTSIYTYTSLALNEQKRLAWVYALASVFNIGANIILIPKYSYVAAASVTFFTELIVIIGSFYICYKNLKLRIDLTKLLRLIPVVIFTAGVLYVVQSLPVLFSALLGLVAFMSLAAFFGVLRYRELSTLFAKGD